MLQAPVKNPSKLCLLFVMSKRRKNKIFIANTTKFYKVILQETVEAASFAKWNILV